MTKTEKVATTFVSLVLIGIIWAILFTVDKRMKWVNTEKARQTSIVKGHVWMHDVTFEELIRYQYLNGYLGDLAKHELDSRRHYSANGELRIYP